MRESYDLNRISLGGPWEADYWTYELGASDGELIRIIGKVGDSVTAVRKELGLVTHETSCPTWKRGDPSHPGCLFEIDSHRLPRTLGREPRGSLLATSETNCSGKPVRRTLCLATIG
jgi:hypothetical protein